jgi:arginase
VGKESLPLVYEAANVTRGTILAQHMPTMFPIIIGGDHSIAIGTWAALVQIYQAKEEFGLIWVDAHMDAHTYETSPSKAYHGMPLAALLGYGEKELTELGGFKPKINPKHLVLIGIRSFEIGEKLLLEKLGVRIIYMDEVKQKGFKDCFAEALRVVTNGTKGFGVSIDMDAFDPAYALGVGSPALGGLMPQEVLMALKQLKNHSALKALEIVEYNPILDIGGKTLQLVYEVVKQV